MRTRYLLALLSLACLVQGACVSTRLLKAEWPVAACPADAGLAGTWTDVRMTQLGPAWVRFTFRCDCSFDSRVQLLWMRITEQGHYEARAGRLIFTRPGGTTDWRFQADATTLTVIEGDEPQRYRLRSRTSCGAVASR